MAGEVAAEFPALGNSAACLGRTVAELGSVVHVTPFQGLYTTTG